MIFMPLAKGDDGLKEEKWGPNDAHDAGGGGGPGGLGIQ